MRIAMPTRAVVCRTFATTTTTSSEIKAPKIKVSKTPKTPKVVKSAPKKSTKPVRDPLKPKRGYSSFMLFLAKRRPALAQEFPEKRLIELTTLAGQEWSRMSAQEKLPYETEAGEKSASYKTQMQAYLATLPPKIKRPSTAFAMFLTENFAKVKQSTPTANVGEIARTIGATWKSLAEDVRQQYLDKSKVAREAYNKANPKSTIEKIINNADTEIGGKPLPKKQSKLKQ